MILGALSTGLWSRIKNWLVPAGVALVIAAGAFFIGRSSGNTDTEAEHTRQTRKP